MKAFAALALGLALLLAAVPAHGMELSETEMDNVGKAFRAAIEAMRAKPTDRFLPPEKYDHAFDGLLFVNRDLDAAAMVVHCPTPPPFGYARLGCSYASTTWCQVFMAEDEILRSAGTNSGDILRHEIAHCNGWPASHPDARTVEPAPPPLTREDLFGMPGGKFVFPTDHPGAR